MAETDTQTDQAKVKNTYVLQCESWIGPHLKEQGDEVDMTEAEAQYYVPHVLQKKAEAQATQKPAEKRVDPTPAAKPAKDKK